jgi:hypothetical protein
MPAGMHEARWSSTPLKLKRTDVSTDIVNRREPNRTIVSNNFDQMVISIKSTFVCRKTRWRWPLCVISDTEELKRYGY